MDNRDKALHETQDADVLNLQSESVHPAGKPWHSPQLKILDARQTMFGINPAPSDGLGYS